MIVLTLIAVAMLAYARPLFLGDTFRGRDHLTHTVPAKTFLAESLRSGNMPEWWDGVGLGVPFAANPNHSSMYPGVWPVAVLPMPWGADFLLVMHLAFAGIGIAFFSRRLGADPMGAVVAGASFMLCGFATSTVVHGGPLFTLAWTPWIALAADRLAHSSTVRDRVRDGATLAALQGVQLLAGDPSFVIISALLAFAVIMVRADERLRTTGVMAAAYVGAVVLAAVVIVPALYLLPETSRAAAAETQQFGVWSMHPARMLEWVWPSALGDTNTSTHNLARAVADSSRGASGLSSGWLLGLYLGLPTLLLAGYGVARSPRRTRWFMAVAGAFVLLALGRYTPIYGIFHTIVLPERLVRYPEKHVMGALVVACAFAGLGLSHLLRAPPSKRAAITGLSVCAAFCALVAIAALSRVGIADWIAGKSGQLRPRLNVDAAVGDVMANGWAAVIVVLLFVGAVYLVRKQEFRGWAGPLVAAIVVGDLVFRSWGVLPLVDRDAVSTPPQILEPVMGVHDFKPRLFRPQNLARAKTSEETDPVIDRHNTAIYNSATMFGFSYLRGYDQAMSERMYRLWHAASASGKRMLNLYGVDYAVLPVHVARPANLSIVGRTARGDIVLARIKTRRPRAFVAPEWRWYDDEVSVREALFPGPKRMRRTAPPRLNTVRLLGKGTSSPPSKKPLPTPECKVHSPKPERVELTCKSATGGFAVLLDSLAPGWTATVDGKSAKIERADVLVRAVKIGPGEHRVVFSYRSPGLRLGALISLLGWLNLFVLFYILRRWRAPAGA